MSDLAKNGKKKKNPRGLWSDPCGAQRLLGQGNSACRVPTKKKDTVLLTRRPGRDGPNPSHWYGRLSANFVVVGFGLF